MADQLFGGLFRAPVTQDEWRLTMRNGAQQLLEVLDGLSQQEFRAAGWTRDEIRDLKRLADWPVGGTQ